MKVHITWLILFALTAAVLFACLLYQRSSVPDYAEAEPLYPIVADFGRVLAESKKGDSVSAPDVKALIQEDRFSSIQPYGVVFSADPETLISIRVNKTFSFDIDTDGSPKWNKK